MPIGEKLWEGKAKTMGMSIKGAEVEGVNTTVALTTQEGDAQWMEFDVVVWEWKQRGNHDG